VITQWIHTSSSSESYMSTSASIWLLFTMHISGFIQHGVLVSVSIMLSVLVHVATWMLCYSLSTMEMDTWATSTSKEEQIILVYSFGGFSHGYLAVLLCTVIGTVHHGRKCGGRGLFPSGWQGIKDGKMDQNISILFKVMLPMVSFNYNNASM
jgi:hypothetical protein